MNLNTLLSSSVFSKELFVIANHKNSTSQTQTGTVGNIQPRTQQMSRTALNLAKFNILCDTDCSKKQAVLMAICFLNGSVTGFNNWWLRSITSLLRVLQKVSCFIRGKLLFSFSLYSYKEVLETSFVVTCWYTFRGTRQKTTNTLQFVFFL